MTRRLQTAEEEFPIGRISSAELRRELSERNRKLAEGLAHESTFGTVPSILYRESDGQHGNFLPASYRRICASPQWRRRLTKCYTASRQLPRSKDRIRRELDCANSSDALLMNIFCYPGVTRRKPLCALLGTEPGAHPRFGVRPGLPLLSGRFDRTEIDMTLDHLLVEAKLTEGNFQSARQELLFRYTDLPIAFDADELPVRDGVFQSYQLIRGVLASHHCGGSFLVLCDGRRDDLREAWYRVQRAVRSCELRSRLKILTWQELSGVLPKTLQEFMATKYGIYAAT